MDDLFDVFDEKPSAAPSAPAEPNSNPNPKKSSNKKKRNKKRKADGHAKDANGDVDMDGDEQSNEDAPNENGDAMDGVDSTNSHNLDGHKRQRREAETESSEKGSAPSKAQPEEDAEPIMTDSFQTAASRKVTAASGFQPTQESEPLTLSHNIQHQVALPPDLDYEYVPLSEHKAPEAPARTYAFQLDPFQRLAISSIEREESVLVSAHTSAGKTVVAEYAIAQCLKKVQRVIYTSPIKALSNQKFRDFQAEFGDVGLMTGDVTINPTASCLVMTTEILRSMLYRGSEVMREVAWVVFDEIHYLRDKSRGVVWEESLILLPDKVRYVFLSATIPNAFQFAEWIAKIHRQACHVVYTDFRPTPLQNYFYPAGGDGIYLVVDERGVFREKNFNTAMAMIEANKPPQDGFGDGQQKGRGRNKTAKKGGSAEQDSSINKIIKTIMKKKFHPVIVFSFSKRECENLALKISNMNMNNDTEKETVNKVFQNAIDMLSEQDRSLPQITHILPLLRKGIGVHHSGLLPILKETIEILFQENLIKVLFATETFSIGLNMPAKTVVFTEVTKWDGVKRRPLTSSEYIQMSGRAGRRGLDDRGIVIMMVDDKLEPETAKAVVAGKQDSLNSAFYLGYNMILNLQRIETVSPEYMLERCFYQFQNTSNVPVLEKELLALQNERDGMVIPDENTVKEYYTLRQQISTYTKDMVAVIQHPTYCLDYLQPGRIVHIRTPDDVDFGWGVVIKTMARKAGKFGEPEFPPQESYCVEVALTISGTSDDFAPGVASGQIPSGVRPVSEDAGESPNARMEIVPCLLSTVVAISQVRLFLPDDLRSQEGKDTVRRALREANNRFPDGLPTLDPIESLGITDESFKKVLRKIEVLEARLLANPLYGSPNLQALWSQYVAKVALGDQIKERKKAIAKAHSVAQLDELKSRKRVLRRLGFLNDAEVVQMKARVACELSSTDGHELLLSELLFDRFFNELTPELCAAVLSCFIFDEKVETKDLPEELAKPYRVIQGKARIVAKVSQESKLPVNEEEYAQSLKWQLMETVYAWAKGSPFVDICKMTNTYEGSLIRLFRRLEELLRQMAQAGKVMGSEDLTSKFEQSLEKIKRDIVAAQSLYL